MLLRVVVVGWIMFAIAVFVAFMFPKAIWSPGPVALLVISSVVILLSAAYGLVMLIRRMSKRSVSR